MRSMKRNIGVRCLLDVNALVALALPNHPFHERAHRWFQRTPKRLWATCPLTQAGFLRVATYLLGGSRQHMAWAIASLDKDRFDPHHEFWQMDVDLTACDASIKSRLLGPNQVADVQLLLLAHRHDGQLATFDTGIRELAASTRYADSLHLI